MNDLEVRIQKFDNMLKRSTRVEVMLGKDFQLRLVRKSVNEIADNTLFLDDLISNTEKIFKTERKVNNENSVKFLDKADSNYELQQTQVAHDNTTTFEQTQSYSEIETDVIEESVSTIDEPIEDSLDNFDANKQQVKYSIAEVAVFAEPCINEVISPTEHGDEFISTQNNNEGEITETINNVNETQESPAETTDKKQNDDNENDKLKEDTNMLIDDKKLQEKNKENKKIGFGLFKKRPKENTKKEEKEQPSEYDERLNSMYSPEALAILNKINAEYKARKDLRK